MPSAFAMFEVTTLWYRDVHIVVIIIFLPVTRQLPWLGCFDAITCKMKHSGTVGLVVW